jgi:hypothetical protein
MNRNLSPFAYNNTPSTDRFRFFELIDLTKLHSLIRVNIIPFNSDDIFDFKPLWINIRLLPVILALSRNFTALNSAQTSV